MKPHADAIMSILMIGDAPNEVQIEEAFKEAGIDRNARGYLAMMGYIKSVGTVQVEQPVGWNKKRFGTIPVRVGVYEVTQKGLGLLE